MTVNVSGIWSSCVIISSSSVSSLGGCVIGMAGVIGLKCNFCFPTPIPPTSSFQSSLSQNPSHCWGQIPWSYPDFCVSPIPHLPSISKFCWGFLQNILEFNHISPQPGCYPGSSPIILHLRIPVASFISCASLSILNRKTTVIYFKPRSDPVCPLPQTLRVVCNLLRGKIKSLQNGPQPLHNPGL